MLYCIVLYCIVLYCIVLYCIVLYCNIPFKDRLKSCPVITSSATITPNIELAVRIF